MAMTLQITPVYQHIIAKSRYIHFDILILSMKSSRLFPLSYLFQKNQYKCDIVPTLPTGLCGIEPVEHAPVRVHPRIGPFNAVSLLIKQFIK